MGYEKLLNYLERKTADTHELQAASAIIGLRQRVQELEKEAKQLRDLQYELMRSGALVAIEKCKNATGQRRVIDMYVSANQIAEDLLNAMDSGA